MNIKHRNAFDFKEVEKFKFPEIILVFNLSIFRLQAMNSIEMEILFKPTNYDSKYEPTKVKKKRIDTFKDTK